METNNEKKYLLIDVFGSKVICNCPYHDLETAKANLSAEFFCFTSDDNNLEYGKDCLIADDGMSAWANLNGVDRVWHIICVAR